MGPAEIVASLKELCAENGPRLSTEQIVSWIDRIDGFETDVELIQYAKKMKARQYARMLEYDDVESGLKIKRLWSFRDQARHRRYYVDILEMPDAERERLVREYSRFVKQLRAVRKAMNDYLAGQAFFDFYPSDEVEVDEPATLDS
jgi:hypothetical protein